MSSYLTKAEKQEILERGLENLVDLDSIITKSYVIIFEHIYGSDTVFRGRELVIPRKLYSSLDKYATLNIEQRHKIINEYNEKIYHPLRKLLPQITPKLADLRQAVNLLDFTRSHYGEDLKKTTDKTFGNFPIVIKNFLAVLRNYFLKLHSDLELSSESSKNPEYNRAKVEQWARAYAPPDIIIALIHTSVQFFDIADNLRQLIVAHLSPKPGDFKPLPYKDAPRQL
jgi:hypothetical protein